MSSPHWSSPPTRTPDPDPDPEPDEDEEPVPGRVAAGTVTVTVLVGAGVVFVLAFDSGLDFVVDVPVPGWKAAYSTLAPGAE